MLPQFAWKNGIALKKNFNICIGNRFIKIKFPPPDWICKQAYSSRIIKFDISRCEQVFTDASWKLWGELIMSSIPLFRKKILQILNIVFLLA